MVMKKQRRRIEKITRKSDLLKPNVEFKFNRPVFRYDDLTAFDAIVFRRF
jgi:hypothetical protein